MMKKFLSAILLSLFFAVTADAGNRKNFDEGWLFLLADSSQMSASEYNDSFWRKLDLPHDWAIGGYGWCSAWRSRVVSQAFHSI